MNTTVEQERPLSDPAAWQKSRKGNRWRRFAGMTLTLFRDCLTDDWRWCVANSEGPSYSKQAFPLLGDCLRNLRDELRSRGVEC